MRKLILLSSLSLTPALSVADTLGLYGGIGQWYIEMEGDVGQGGVNTSLTSLGVRDETATTMWLNFEHPIPFLPNLRLMHSEIDTVAHSEARQLIFIGNLQIEVQTHIQTTLDLSHTDATLYYEILDNWVHFDLGITARKMSGYVEVIPEFGGEFRATMDGVIPTAYVNLQIDVPSTGLQIGAVINAATYRGDQITDLSVRIGYAFEITPLMSIGVDVGYRSLDILAKDFYSLYADAKLSGTYAELRINF
jgi:outer membrane protein